MSNVMRMLKCEIVMEVMNSFIFLFYCVNVYNSKFLYLHRLLGLARATCVEFLYEFLNVCTKATTLVYPPPHSPL